MTTQWADGKAPRDERIVVGFDGSPHAWGALRWAADEAGRRRADLEVVSCPPTPGVPDGSEEKLVDDAARVAEERGWRIHVSGVVEGGSPGDVLIDRSQGAAMLVLGASTEGELSEYCETHAACAVTVATSASQPDHTPPVVAP
jgi:nucleotide-binding universal stress UspA family protein